MYSTSDYRSNGYRYVEDIKHKFSKKHREIITEAYKDNLKFNNVFVSHPEFGTTEFHDGSIKILKFLIDGFLQTGRNFQHYDVIKKNC